MAIVMANEEMKLIQQLLRKDMGVAEIHLLLKEQGIRTSVWQYRPADPVVLDSLMFVGISDPELISLLVIVEHPA